MSIRFGRSGDGYSSSEVMQTEDDDWRQVEDVAERRRRQNRLAQRNYRRKLRERIEFLSKQAGIPSEASNPSQRPRGSTSSGDAGQDYETTSTGHKRRRRSSAGRRDRETENLARGEEVIDLGPSPAVQASATTDFSSNNSSSGRNYVSGDFGPLFTTLDMRPPRGTISRLPRVPRIEVPKTPPQESDHQSPNAPISATSLSTMSPDDNYTFNGLESLDGFLNDDSMLAVPELSPAGTSPATPQSALTSAASYPSPGRSPLEMASWIRSLDLEKKFPQPSPHYSPNPLINPNPLHLNPPIPADDFFISMPHHKTYWATMQSAKVLNLSEYDMLDDDVLSPFNNREQSFVLPEGMEDLKPTAMQQAIPHHPYIDILPFPQLRDRIIQNIKDPEGAVPGFDEDRLCTTFHESCDVWGEAPWDRQSWELGEQFIREFYYLVDEEIVRVCNFWRQQRHLKPLNLRRIIKEVLEAKKLNEHRKLENSMASKGPLAARGRIVGEVA